MSGRFPSGAAQFWDDGVGRPSTTGPAPRAAVRGPAGAGRRRRRRAGRDVGRHGRRRGRGGAVGRRPGDRSLVAARVAARSRAGRADLAEIDPSGEPAVHHVPRQQVDLWDVRAGRWLRDRPARACRAAGSPTDRRSSSRGGWWSQPTRPLGPLAVGRCPTAARARRASPRPSSIPAPARWSTTSWSGTRSRTSSGRSWRSARTAGGSPSPPAWPRPCSTPGRARWSSRSSCRATGYEASTARSRPVGVVCCAGVDARRLATAARDAEGTSRDDRRHHGRRPRDVGHRGGASGWTCRSDPRRSSSAPTAAGSPWRAVTATRS